jgi:hypothetical protein
LVYVRTSHGTYADTTANFSADSGKTLPDLPAGANERLYVQGRKHPLMGDGNVVDGGPLPWALGDQIIASVDALIAAQATRRAANQQ